MKYARVRILNVPYSADKSYDYHIPTHLEDSVFEGSIVVVPFGGGNSAKNALVEEISDKTDCKKTKPILGVPGKYLKISEEMLGLCKFMSERLYCSVGDAVKCVLPSGLGVQRATYYTAQKDKIMALSHDSINPASLAMLDYISGAGRISETDLKKHFGAGSVAGAKALVAMGLCTSETGYECKINSKDEKYAVLSGDENVFKALEAGQIKLTPAQRAVYEILSCAEMEYPVSELMQTAGVGASVIKELTKKGVIRVFDVSFDRSKDTLAELDKCEYGDFELSEKQNKALKELVCLYEQNEPKAALLYGVTGSGKTNVLLKLIDRVLESGKTVIVLVPEIALTGQTVGRFSARYKKDGIALIHSGLSAGERMDAWKRINDGVAKIVIGTRSAVFAPVKNIGLIVMDEEHEGSFKSDKAPKYHARDIAKYRCAYHKALLCLASATPGVDSFYNAKSGKYSLVKLDERYGNASLAKVEFYDMKNEPYYIMPDDEFNPETFSADEENEPLNASAGAGESEALPLVIGSTLKKELEECIGRHEQAILFINRRGYRSFAVCRSCSYVFTCPNCSVSMTHHKNKKTGKSRMVCHYCGYSENVPEVCPECKKQRISFMGSGTQLVEETLSKELPSARILRMDADTVSGKSGHEKILSEFRKGNADILIGTQMVAKGHDFPKVSLVGVALADTSLFVNDFRANEKTFSLLTQVLGRAGRTEKTAGKAVVQTYVPDNEVLNLAAEQNYESFYEREIAFRKASVFPPFCDIVTVSFSASVENDVINAVKIFGKELDALAKSEYTDVKFILYGPFRNEIYKLAGKYRMRYIIKCRNSKRFRSMLSFLLKKFMPALKDVSISADINPTNL